MTKSRTVILFVLLILITFYSNNRLYSLHLEQKDEAFSQLARIPGPIAKLVSLEFTGVASDFLMLQTLSYLGGKLFAKENINKDQYQLIYKAIDQITHLDPRFLDPYVLAEMTLPFDAGMVEETNELLEKVIKVRKNDYRPFLFLWYNYYHFLKDPATGAKYLKQAARIPGAPQYYSTLAARSSFYGGETEAGIIFLQEIVNETHDQNRKKYLLLRLEALKRIFFLEQKLKIYKEMYGTPPKTLNLLIEKGLIEKIPEDPYGGTFYIVSEGHIYSTSKLVVSPKKTNSNTN